MLTQILPSSNEKAMAGIFVTATSFRYTNLMFPCQAIGGHRGHAVGASDRIGMLRFEESPLSVVAFLLSCFWEDSNPLENNY